MPTLKERLAVADHIVARKVAAQIGMEMGLEDFERASRKSLATCIANREGLDSLTLAVADYDAHEAARVNAGDAAPVRGGQGRDDQSVREDSGRMFWLILIAVGLIFAYAIVTTG